MCTARNPGALYMAFHNQKGAFKPCQRLFLQAIPIAINGLRWSDPDNLGPFGFENRRSLKAVIFISFQNDPGSSPVRCSRAPAA
jgi:hypothetical protein